MTDDKNPRPATEAVGLREQVQPIVDRLPRIQYQPMENGEIDHYGARFCIAELLGLGKPLYGRATWVHRWIWPDVNFPEQIVGAEHKGVSNLVRSKEHELLLRSHGFDKAVAVGVPFLYPHVADVPRIPDSLLVFPMHTTQCTSLTVHDEVHVYVEYVKQLRKQFSLVVASIGCEDVRCGNWIPAFEKAGIPWITGAWSHDRHALVRIQTIMRHFEFTTSNSTGSHFAYAAYCGCKMSFSGPVNDLELAELDTHPFYKTYPHLAKIRKQSDPRNAFKAKFPFFFVNPKDATVQVDWAKQALGEENRKQPEEIAKLFEWTLRKLPSGRWASINPLDGLSNEDLFAKAVAKTLLGRHDESFKLTNVLKRRHVRLRDVEVIRARYFLSVNDTAAAREALKKELHNFPDNAQAAGMLQELGANAFLDPIISPEFADLYLVRKGILEQLNQAIALFSGTLLDVGCGQMPYRDHILAQNRNITGYVGLDFATGRYADRRQPDLTWDGRVIPLADGSVDCAMATEVLEHCPDPLPVLKEIRRVLVPGGCFFFTTPFLWPIHDAPNDYFRYTPYALKRLLEAAGFADIRVEAMGGWNAALAQMIGLWLRRAPMPENRRAQLTRDLFPFFSELVRSDVPPADFSQNSMITSLAGTAKAPLTRAASSTASPRVVVVTLQFPTLSETFILDQMTGLMDKGLTVEHWSLLRMNEPVVHEKVQRYGLMDTTRFITLPPDALRDRPRQWAKAFLHQNGIATLEGVSSIQLHFGTAFNRLAPLFAAYPDLFTVVSFHGFDASSVFVTDGPDVYAGLFARANLVTTPSRFMKDRLVAHGCPPQKLVVHHYGKDTKVFSPAPREQARQKVRILTVARFVEKKGLEYALAAFAKAQAGFDVEYRIVGYGPLALVLATIVHRLGLDSKVTFLGPLPNDAVRQEMAAADIFVLTSVTASNGDQEGVPVCLIEAQALGLPVVSSRHAGIPELVTHGETGFLAEERNIDEIAGYLRVLIKNPKIRSEFAANAREKVLREFDLAQLNDALAGYLVGGHVTKRNFTYAQDSAGVQEE